MIGTITLTQEEIREAVAKYVGSVGGVNAAAANVEILLEPAVDSAGLPLGRNTLVARVTVEKR